MAWPWGRREREVRLKDGGSEALGGNRVCLWGCQHGLSVQGGHLLLGEWIGPCAPGERGELWVRKDCLCADLPTSVAVCFVGSVSFRGSGQSL